MELYTVQQVAQITGLSIKTIDTAIKHGFLKVIYPNKQRRIRRDDLKKWLNKRN